MSGDNNAFYNAVESLAVKAGVPTLLSIPGVWECVSEHFNNAAIDLMAAENDEEEEEASEGTAPDECQSCSSGSGFEFDADATLWTCKDCGYGDPPRRGDNG